MIERETFQALIDQFLPGSRVIAVRPLSGGISAQTTAVDYERSDGLRATVVVRQHGATDRSRNPQIARDEFRLLSILQEHRIAAPKPLHLDESGILFSAPVIAIEYIEHDPPPIPLGMTSRIVRAAGHLALIHRLPALPKLDFLPRLDTTIKPPDASLHGMPDEARIRDALSSAPLPPVEPPALLHGDYWPGNLLWNEGRLAAVIDWEDAALGDPLADLANARLEWLWAAGAEAMERFTEHYRQKSGRDLRHLPWWDLRAALRHCGRIAEYGLDPATEERWIAEHRRFAETAITRLNRS